MISPRLGVLAPLNFCIALALFGADDIRVTPGAVDDQRYSESRFGGLSIELTLGGAGAADVRAVRVKVKSAKDDSGTALTKSERDDKPGDFEEYSKDRHPGPEIRLPSPRREASKIDVAGEVEMFIPTRDPDTRLKIENFLSRLDKPIVHPALKGANVEITPLSSKEYKARQGRNKPSKEEIAAEGKKSGASDKDIQQALALMDALSSLGGEEPSETSVLLETKDPEGKIISIDIVHADGSELHAGSRATTGGRDAKMVKIDLSEKPPADAALALMLRTGKSLVVVPFHWKEISLP